MFYLSLNIIRRERAMAVGPKTCVVAKGSKRVIGDQRWGEVIITFLPEPLDCSRVESVTGITLLAGDLFLCCFWKEIRFLSTRKPHS